MNGVYEYLEKKGYTVPKDYYNYIENWTNIWKGKAAWLDVKTTDGKTYPMYSLGMAKRSCEDLASTITSEPFVIKGTKNNKILQQDIESSKLLKKLPLALEAMAYSGTVGMITRIKDALIVGEGDEAVLKKGNKTKINIITVDASHIIPLTIEDGEIINVAFVSESTIKYENKTKKVIYLELHELEERGYQITNVYFDKENNKEIPMEGIIKTYNTLSDQPMFAIGKLPKTNVIDDNGGLGMSLFGDSLDQLQMLDLTYNNFGSDFKLGQKILLVNKKLTKIQTEEYTDANGAVKTRQKVIYPTDIQKQLFTDISDGIMSSGADKPYIYEYNPDLRVGDNKEGVQFALDNYSFKIGFGTHYYSFEKGNLMTATEAVLSRQDFVVNGNKIRRSVNEFLQKICGALLVSEKILGTKVDEKQNIDIAEVDGFLQDEETVRDKLFTDLGAGLISKKKYLMKVYNMTEDEALQELEEIAKEEEPIETMPEDEGE